MKLIRRKRMQKNDFTLSISRDSFYQTSMFIFEHFGLDVKYNISLIVNEAITCELSIKVILEKLNIRYGKSHSLFDLLSLLPTDVQDKIIYDVSNNLKHSYDNVIKNIQIFSYAVVDWRYLDNTMVIEFNTLHQLMLTLYDISKRHVYYEITKVEKLDNDEEDLDNKLKDYRVKALNESAKRILNERKYLNKKD